MKYLNKFNEEIEDNYYESFLKENKEEIENKVKILLDDVSGSLDVLTTSVSNEIIINDKISLFQHGSLGEYEYEIKIKRIS